MAHSTNDIQKLYLAYFSRPADLAGLDYWQHSGVTLAEIAASFSQSSEYTQRFAGMDNSGVVRQVYYNLFARDGEPAGVAYWSGLLDKGAIQIGSVVTSMLEGAQGRDKVAVASKLDAMSQFCDAVANGADVSLRAGLMPADLATARAWLSNVSDAASLANAQVAMPSMLKAMGAVPGANVVLSGHVRAIGAIAGATVFVDTNHNGIPEQGEASAVTDLNGFYLLSGRIGPAAHQQTVDPLHVDVLVQGGVDAQTGLANKDIFTWSYDTTSYPYMGAQFKEAHVDFGPQGAHFHDAGIALTGIPATTFE